VGLQAGLEAAVDVGTFRTAALRRAVREERPVRDALEKLEGAWKDPALATEIADAAIRFAFLVEPVQAQNSAGTKMTARWAPDGTREVAYEAFDEDDARYASYEECLDVFETVTSGLLEARGDAESAALIRRMRKKGAIAL
jgi:hypothetical protein